MTLWSLTRKQRSTWWSLALIYVYIWWRIHSQRYRWRRLFNDFGYSSSWPSRETPSLSKRSESNRLQHRKFCGVTKQDAVPSWILDSQGKFCAVKSSGVLDLFEDHFQKDWKYEMHFPQFRHLEVTVSMKLLMRNVFRFSPMRGEIFWQKKKPRERKVSSVPNQEETIILFIDYPKHTNCEDKNNTSQV